METQVAGNAWAEVIHYDEWRTVELKWNPMSRDMSDDELKQTLELFAASAEKIRPQWLIIDATDFQRRFTDGSFLRCLGGRVEAVTQPSRGHDRK